MPTLWTYPWTLEKEGVRKACTKIAQFGFDSITIPAHYHSVQTFEPRFLDAPFNSYPAGCYFDPDPSQFSQSAVKPTPVELTGFEDPVEEITSIAHDVGLDVNAWVVCFHNSTLAQTNPDFRAESAFGDQLDHSVCPSSSEVRSYFAAVLDAIINRGVDEVQLESIGFPSAFHPHGWNFGHSKRHVFTKRIETLLMSQCFCEHCRAGIRNFGVDIDTARDTVQSLLKQRLQNPETELQSITELSQDDSHLNALLEYRKASISQFLAALSDVVGQTPLNYYLMEWPGFTVDDVQLAGVKVADIAESLDRITALCYVDTPEAARRRVTPLTEITPLPVDAGVTLDPSVIDSRASFESVIDELRQLRVENVSVYHHSLESQAQLEWVQETLNS